MRLACLLAVTVSVLSPGMLSAQDGAAIYKERCASCHDMPEGRTPPLSAIKAMTGEAIYTALSSGAMKTQAQGLAAPQLFALIGYIAPTGSASAPAVVRTCTGDSSVSPAAFAATMNAPRWNGWSTGTNNARFQDARSAGLTASTVPALKVKWAFNLGNTTTARSQPVIV